MLGIRLSIFFGQICEICCGRGNCTSCQGFSQPPVDLRWTCHCQEDIWPGKWFGKRIIGRTCCIFSGVRVYLNRQKNLHDSDPTFRCIEDHLGFQCLAFDVWHRLFRTQEEFPGGKVMTFGCALWLQERDGINPESVVLPPSLPNYAPCQGGILQWNRSTHPTEK